MEAPMIQKTYRSRLDVQASFELTRFAPTCLIEAYARVVPVSRTPLGQAARDSTPPAVAQPQSRGGEHV
jgi:hypothetical protein